MQSLPYPEGFFRSIRRTGHINHKRMPQHDLHLGRTEFGIASNAGSLMSIEEANQLLREWVGNEKLQLHMRQVAALMKAWAIEREGADQKTALAWELSGLLHDADWEKYPDTHCKKIIEELERRNIDPAVIRCIASHGPKYFGVEPETKMDKMIYVFDELSGFIHAAALIRPTGYEGMDMRSVLKKLKTLSFAAQVNREDITDAISRIDQSLEEIILFILDHQKDVQ
jgi:predicted hydrolase (HD superfamily)